MYSPFPDELQRTVLCQQRSTMKMRALSRRVIFLYSPNSCAIYTSQNVYKDPMCYKVYKLLPRSILPEFPQNILPATNCFQVSNILHQKKKKFGSGANREKGFTKTRNIVPEAASLFIFFDSELNLPIIMCI